MSDIKDWHIIEDWHIMKWWRAEIAASMHMIDITCGREAMIAAVKGDAKLDGAWANYVETFKDRPSRDFIEHGPLAHMGRIIERRREAIQVKRKQMRKCDPYEPVHKHLSVVEQRARYSIKDAFRINGIPGIDTHIKAGRAAKAEIKTGRLGLVFDCQIPAKWPWTPKIKLAVTGQASGAVIQCAAHLLPVGGYRKPAMLIKHKPVGVDGNLEMYEAQVIPWGKVDAILTDIKTKMLARREDTLSAATPSINVLHTIGAARLSLPLNESNPEIWFFHKGGPDDAHALARQHIARHVREKLSK